MAKHQKDPFAADELEQWARHVLIARRTRLDVFNPALFSDPAWDILLLLFLARLRQEQLCEADLAEAVGISPQTSARWLAMLEKEGLVRRKAEQGHGGGIELSARGSSAMQAWAQASMSSMPNGQPGVMDLLMRMRGDGP